MNDLVPLAWVGVGVMAGIPHAVGLWRRAHRQGQASMGDVAIVTTVVVTLVVAAMAGGIFPAVIGWSCGLAVTGLVLYARKST